MPDTVADGFVRCAKAEAVLDTAALVAADVTVNQNKTSTMRVALIGLTPGTAYYYQAGDGVNWGDVYSFTTDDGVSA